MDTFKWRAETWAKDAPDELAESLNNFELDDKKPPSLPQAVKEAQYIVGLYHEGGTTSSEALSGELGHDAKKAAQRTIRECKAFIKKYSAR